MSMRPQPETLMVRVALSRALTVLALFFLFLASANSAIQAMPDHVAVQSVVDAAPLDCPASEQRAGHMHCQTVTLGIMEKSQATTPITSAPGSSTWRYAAVTCGPIPIHQRLLRPPKPFRALV